MCRHNVLMFFSTLQTETKLENFYLIILSKYDQICAVQRGFVPKECEWVSYYDTIISLWQWTAVGVLPDLHIYIYTIHTLLATII